MSFTSVNQPSIAVEQRPDTSSERIPSWGPLLLAIGALGPVIFVGLVAIGGALTDGYSHSSQTISELAATGAEHAALQTVAFIVVGVGVCSYAAGLHLVGRVPVLATALVATFGVLSAFAQAALPCDQGCEPDTAIGTGHILTGATGFVAILVAMFVLARHWQRLAPDTILAKSTRIAAWAGLVSLIAFNVTRARDLESLDGLAQRAFALVVIAWIVVTALTLRQRTEPN